MPPTQFGHVWPLRGRAWSACKTESQGLLTNSFCHYIILYTVHLFATIPYNPPDSPSVWKRSLDAFCAPKLTFLKSASRGSLSQRVENWQVDAGRVVSQILGLGWETLGWSSIAMYSRCLCATGSLMFWLISCTSWKPSAIMVLRILLLIVASVAEDDEACITNSVLMTKTCWRYDCGCSAAPDVRPFFLASCCRLDYVSATHVQSHGQRDASGMLALQTEFASQLPRSSRTHLLISHSRSLHNLKGINWRRRMKASKLLLSTSPDLSFKNQCRSLSVLSCVVAAASKEMYEPVVNVTERLGEDGWCIFGGLGTWTSNCAIARHKRDSMIFVKTLLSWSSWSSSQFTLSIFFHHKLFLSLPYFVCLWFLVPSCRRYFCWFVKWGLKMNTRSFWMGRRQRLLHFAFLTIAL